MNLEPHLEYLRTFKEDSLKFVKKEQKNKDYSMPFDFLSLTSNLGETPVKNNSDSLDLRQLSFLLGSSKFPFIVTVNRGQSPRLSEIEKILLQEANSKVQHFFAGKIDENRDNITWIKEGLLIYGRETDEVLANLSGYVKNMNGIYVKVGSSKKVLPMPVGISYNFQKFE